MVESKTVGVVTELTLIVPVKSGAGPKVREALAFIGNNPAPLRTAQTTHFARYVLFDNDTRLLMACTFDGTWEKYLRDAVRVKPQYLDLVWSNCVDYPGCNPYEPFAAWVQKHQVETTLFYAAYPAATVKDVLQAVDWKAKTDKFQEALALPPDDAVGQATRS